MMRRGIILTASDLGNLPIPEFGGLTWPNCVAYIDNRLNVEATS